MKIIYKISDALKGSEEFLAHGCNAKGVMASGIAKAIKDQFPTAFDVYRIMYEKHGLRLGDVIIVPGTKNIFNCITQENYGRDPNVQYVDYDAIRKSMAYISSYMIRHPDFRDKEYQKVAMPTIGAGLGNGDWEVIEKIIEEESIYFQPVVYVLDEVMINEFRKSGRIL